MGSRPPVAIFELMSGQHRPEHPVILGRWCSFDKTHPLQAIISKQLVY